MNSDGTKVARRQTRGRFTRLRWSSGAVCAIALLAAPVRAAPTLDVTDPIGFFTNLASRLLQSELDLSLTHIQVWPTNQYTPAVHRLLQVTANIYDAATNRLNDSYPHLPTVFRPRFANDGGNVFISGYVEENGTNFLSNPMRDLSNPADRAALQLDDNVYGIPLIIGAKKGFPNFNEFALQTVVLIQRKLEFRKQIVGGPVTETNQMYVIGVSNTLGAEAWNSYGADFPRDLNLIYDSEHVVVMTNEYGALRSNVSSFGQALSVPANTWTGSSVHPQPSSFLVPLSTNVVFLTNSVYVQAPPGGLTNVGAPFESGLGFPVPQWGLLVGNRLRFALVDSVAQRVVDYVSLADLGSELDVTGQIMGHNMAEGSVMDRVWATNRIGNSTNIYVPTFGIINQLEICLGNQLVTLSDWNSYGLQSVNGQDKAKAIDAFRVFFGLSPLDPPVSNTNLIWRAPFNPARKLWQFTSWQANDPLVHYHASDLTDLLNANKVYIIQPPTQPVPALRNVGKLNDRYRPWGGNPSQSTDPNAYALPLKDPGVRCSDDWDFPTNQPLNSQWLGRVHRGTPWQTVYLKSAAADLQTWRSWAGGANNHEASLSLPTNDWRLAGLLVSLLNTNHPRNLLSVNDNNATAWLSVLGGVTVLTNTLTDAELGTISPPPPPPQFDSVVMQSNSPQAAVIAAAINAARLSQPSQRFRRLGDVLATRELSVFSPWLNQSSSIQIQKGITDEAYEKIPSQLLSLLRADSVGSAVGSNSEWHVQFTGFDGYPYAVEVSSNLLDWVCINTNWPADGMFSINESASPSDASRFYRSVLLP